MPIGDVLAQTEDARDGQLDERFHVEKLRQASLMR